MTWMNEWDVEDAVRRFNYANTPNLAEGARVLDNLVRWTNRNSDGWPYWRKPSRAASQLMGLLEGVDRYDPDDITAAQLKKALAPIKAFFTRAAARNFQGVDALEVRRVFDV